MTDKLTRHKWPEEKPEHNKNYLTLSIYREYRPADNPYLRYDVATWKDELTSDECRGPFGRMHEETDSGFYEMDSDGYWMSRDDVEYFWELPEVWE